MIARRSLIGFLAWLPFVGKVLADTEPHAVEPISPRIFARKGDLVTCENHHIICEAAHDIMFGDMPTETEFVNWSQPQPAFGTPADEVPACIKCGARWWNGKDFGQHMHFADGWR